MRKSLHLALVPILMGGLEALIPTQPRARETVRLERVDLPGPSGEPSFGGTAELPFRASHLGVVWHGSEEARVEVRLLEPEPGRWEQVEVADDLSDPSAAEISSGLILAGGATRAEVRVRRGPASDLGLVAIDAAASRPGVSEAGRAAAGPTGGASIGASAGGPGAGKVPDPQIIGRAGWGADESMRRGSPEFAPVRKLLVHHTVTPNDDPDPPATVRAIYAYHTQQKGWNDVAYQFLIDARGRVYEGRFARPYGPGETPSGEAEDGRGVIGAHARDTNTGTVGVALLGNFVDSVPTDAAMSSLERVLSWKAQRHGVDVRAAEPYTGVDGRTRTFPNLAGHRDVGATECPGGRLYEALPGLRERVAGLGDAAGETPVGPGTGPTPGYWIVTGDGEIRAHGEARTFDPATPVPLRLDSVVALAPTRSGQGLWLLDASGGVHPYGDARTLGPVAGSGVVGDRMVDLARTGTGLGYWLLDAGGGVHPYGDARLLGSLAGTDLAAPVVAMASTPSGGGYWLVAGDGGVFAFGDAKFLGSLAGTDLAAPVVAMASTPSGGGYWLVAGDGGVFAFGDAKFLGRPPGAEGPGDGPGRAGPVPVVGLRATITGRGYYVVAAHGLVSTFGDARLLPSSEVQPGDWALLRRAPAVSALALLAPG